MSRKNESTLKIRISGGSLKFGNAEMEKAEMEMDCGNLLFNKQSQFSNIKQQKISPTTAISQIW